MPYYERFVKYQREKYQKKLNLGFYMEVCMVKLHYFFLITANQTKLILLAARKYQLYSYRIYV